MTAEVPLVVTSATADYGTATLTVNGTQIAQVNYGASTQSSIASALATAASGNSLVNVTVVDNALYLESKSTDGDYAYSLSIVSTNSLYTSNPSFESEPASGNLTGGDASNTSGQTIYGYTASYDAASNLLSDTDSVMGPWSFSYDTLNRLTIGSTTATTGQYVGQHLCWSYDDFGNRTAQVMQTGACTSFPASATYYPNNQISWTSANNAGSDITYDAAGNVVFDGVNAYLYDGEGRLCAVRSIGFDGGGMTGYIYDADGTRVAKGTITSWSCNPSMNGFQSSNEYVLDLGGQQLAEWAMNATGMTWQHTNVFAGGHLIATYDGGPSSSGSGNTYGLHFYANDALGTRRAQTDYAGVLEQACSSLPYGDQLSCTGSTTAPTEHHFTGKERDTESGNDYFEARYYASAVGRFMSPDWSAKEEPVPYAKMDDPQSLNLYSYVRNNPLTRMDADGHIDCSGSNGSGAGCQFVANMKAGFGITKSAQQQNSVSATGQPNPTNSSGHPIDKDAITNYADQHAEPHSLGKCAAYCRRAFEAGGVDTNGHPVDAKDWGPTLLKNGATVISPDGYKPQKADVAVFAGSDAHPHGHITIYDGKQWVSDFKQNNMSPYRSGTTPSTIYRFPDN